MSEVSRAGWGDGNVTALPETIRRPSGIYLPATPPPHAWLKLKGEPAQVLLETPGEFMERWQDFVQRVYDWTSEGRISTPPVLVCHDRPFGMAVFFLPEAINEIAYIQVTCPTDEATRTRPGSVYLGQCPCAQWGGPCPPLPDGN